MRRAIVLLFCVGALLLGPDRPVRAATLVDATGHQVALPDRPLRILPAGPPAAVLLAALAPDLMIGWPVPPGAAAAAFLPDRLTALPRTPMLTGRADLSAEAAALHPDLILDYGTVSPRYADLDRGLQAKLGIATVLMSGALRDLPDVLHRLGAALHREPRADALARLAEAILIATPRSDHGPTVVFARGADGLDVAAPDTGATEVFQLLGWRVLAPDGPGTYRHTSSEAIARLDPDVLIFADPAMRQVVAHDPGWRALRAVRERNAYIAPDLPFGWFDEPPSINRLTGLAVLGARGGGTVALASIIQESLWGRLATPAQLTALRNRLLPIEP